ncbi:MAG TPA: phosphoribosyltransferase [Bryobacteraceae bacterium]|nr:phosphoribosyltransferase [Bryobacteraceae bacterium]
MMERIFTNRRDAGRRLAILLGKYRGREDCIVVALPRGGVVVGFEIAQALDLPMDVCVVRKLGVPFRPELAMGAVAMGGVTVLHRNIIAHLGITNQELERETALELAELRRRERAYRGDRPTPGLAGKTVLLVDDGIATGATAEAAMEALRRLGARRVVIAVGVASREAVAQLSRHADEVVPVLAPAALSSIGEWYEDFAQTSDEEVITLLRRAREASPKPAASIP